MTPAKKYIGIYQIRDVLSEPVRWHNTAMQTWREMYPVNGNKITEGPPLL